jgi:hypothetical protein
MTILLGVLAVSPASTQQKKAVPPPPKPDDGGPSLEVTMKFIQDKMNSIGPVNYAVYFHDNATGADWTKRSKFEVTQMVAEAPACAITYHEKGWPAAESESSSGFFLKNVEDVVVMPMEQYQQEAAAAAGHPSWSSRVDPPVFVLKVRESDVKGTNNFDFFDEQLPNRVARAIVHAVELCGGGGKKEEEKKEEKEPF